MAAGKTLAWETLPASPFIIKVTVSSLWRGRTGAGDRWRARGIAGGVFLGEQRCELRSDEHRESGAPGLPVIGEQRFRFRSEGVVARTLPFEKCRPLGRRAFEDLRK
jgi:hypothetical protein